MSSNDRLRRDKPIRIEPVRNFSGLYEWCGSDARPTSSTSSAIPNNGRTDGKEQTRDEAVGLAYRVIEKHISDGKRDAGHFNREPYGRAATGRFQELFERTLRSQIELFPFWIEALSSAVKIDPSWTSKMNGTANGPDSNSAASHSSKAIVIEVASVRPVQVSAKFLENYETLPIVSLRDAVDETKPKLSDISFAFDTPSGALKIKISVPDTHPPGVYSGVIASRDTGEPMGTLSVRIAE